MLSSLNQRLFLIRRLQNVMNRSALIKVANSLFMSKIRYGLQLLGKVRLTNEDSSNEVMKTLQVAQNKLVRLLNGKTLKDKINTEVLLKNIGMASVNQINCQIKLLEIWKAINIQDYPIKVKNVTSCIGSANTRSGGNDRLVEIGNSNLSAKTFINDATKIWNRAPKELKECPTLYAAKKAIKQFSKTLPFLMLKAAV